MTGFLRGLWNAITATKNAFTNLIFLIIMIVIVVGIFSSDSVSLPDSAALVLDPGGEIVEQQQVTDPLAQYLAGGEREQETRLFDLLLAMKEGAKDDRIKVLVLDLSRLAAAPMSMLEELGAGITAFKATGKPVYAFGPAYTQTQYFLAARADRVYVDRHAFQALGGVFLTGFGIYPTYFKDVLDRFKVRFHVFRTGQFKAAVEPYLRNDMSAEAREANQAWINELWDAYASNVVNHRPMPLAEFTRYANEYDVVLGESGDDPTQLALDQGLVDELISKEEFDQRLIKLVGESGDRARRINFRDYLRITQPPIPVLNPASDKIAVITAKGTILDGEQPAGTIGGDSLSDLITTAREDQSVKAVVVRIDSPGGSASAAEQIRAQLDLVQSGGKPVVVSMSGYAASGGYWIAATANRIFAQETTITGSIGTFIVFPTFDEALADFGVRTDGVGTTSLSGGLDPFRALNPVMERSLQRTVNNTYAKFVELVAEGRDLPVATVDELAQGRVWTGRKALALGLIDGIGNLDTAVSAAAVLADIRDYDVLYLEKTLSTRERLVNELLNAGLSALAPVQAGPVAGFDSLLALPEEIRSLLRMSGSPGVYLQCLYCRVSP